jgi:hypothetical protein
MNDEQSKDDGQHSAETFPAGPRVSRGCAPGMLQRSIKFSVQEK